MGTVKNTILKSEFASRYGVHRVTVTRALEAALEAEKAKFQAWFTFRKLLYPSEVKPIAEYLEKELCWERVNATN